LDAQVLQNEVQHDAEQGDDQQDQWHWSPPPIPARGAAVTGAGCQTHADQRCNCKKGRGSDGDVWEHLGGLGRLAGLTEDRTYLLAQSRRADTLVGQLFQLDRTQRRNGPITAAPFAYRRSTYAKRIRKLPLAAEKLNGLLKLGQCAVRFGCG
jgi:hypothetical protein